MARYEVRMARYIDAYSLRDKVFESKKNNPHSIAAIKRNHNCEHEHFLKLIACEPTADVVEVKKIAEMLNDLFGDNCPCNYCGIDEWLPYLCEYANTCDCPCVNGWEQFIKHYDKRKEGAEE